MIPKSIILVLLEIEKFLVGKREFFSYGALTFAFAIARAREILALNNAKIV